jgi:hypothetical protein
VEVVSRKTITKKFAFVILWLSVSFNFAACYSAVSKEEKQIAGDLSKQRSQTYQKPQTSGKIESKEITESSGIVASKCQTDVFWTHNDSGGGAYVFAMSAKGKHLGAWRVAKAKNTDWEDIAAFKNERGECFLFIGDIGNNARDRIELTVYRVREPNISEVNKLSNKKNALAIDESDAIKFKYPDLSYDAETLLIHPQTGDIYILTKQFSGASAVYKLAKDYSFDKTNRLEKITDFTVPAVPNGFLTGGDISSDGRRVIVSDYFSGYELIIPEKAENFDEIWKQKPLVVELGERAQGEAVCYSVDGNSIFATSEKQNSLIIEVRKK